jgi:hypothetical protein
MLVYESDNASAWDFMPSGEYVRREPGDGEERRAAQECFIRKAQDQRSATQPPEAMGRD